MEDRYGTKDIADLLNLSKTAVIERVHKLKIVPIEIRFGKWLFTKNQCKQIIDFKNEKPIDGFMSENYDIPNVIYVHTTWEIRESKLNFTQ